MAEAISTHRLSLENEMYLDPYLVRHSIALPYSNDLKLANPYYPGHTLIYYPFFKLSEILDKVSCFEQINILFSPRSRIIYTKMVLTWLANFLFLFSSFILIHKILIETTNLKEKYIIAALLMIFISTPWIYYSAIEYAFLHNIEIFISSLFLFTWLKRKYDSKLYYIMLGGIFALLFSIRLINVSIYLFFLIYAINENRFKSSKLKSFFKAFAYVLIGALPIVMFLGYYNSSIFGSVFATGYPKSFSTFQLGIKEGIKAFILNIYNYHFSPVRGLFAWHPLLLLSYIGFFIFKPRYLQKLIIISLTAFSLLLFQYKIWWGGTSYGQRFFLCCIPFFAIGLGYIMEISIKKIFAVSCLLVCYSLLLLISFYAGATKGSNEFYSIFTITKYAIHNYDKIMYSITSRIKDNKLNAYEWTIKQMLSCKAKKEIVITDNELNDFELTLPKYLGNKNISFYIRIYSAKEKKFPEQFLLFSYTEAYNLGNGKNVFKIGRIGLPSPIISLQINDKPLNLRETWVNYNTLLQKSKDISLILGLVDCTNNQLTYYYEIISNKGHNFIKNVHTIKSVLYDAGKPEYQKYSITSLEDNNAILLFWQAKNNIPFFIELLKLKKDEKVNLPKGIKPLSRQYFKGAMWIISEKPIIFN